MCVNIFIYKILRSMYILVVASNTKKYDCLIIQTAQLHAHIQQNTTKKPQTDIQICMKNYTHGACKAKLIKLIDFYSQSNKLKISFIDGNIRKYNKIKNKITEERIQIIKMCKLKVFHLVEGKRQQENSARKTVFCVVFFCVHFSSIRCMTEQTNKKRQ